MTGVPDWPLGLAWMAHALSRDLQRAARVAGGPQHLWAGDAPHMASWLRQGTDDALRAVRARDAFRAYDARQALAARGITHVPITSPGYPSRLLRIFDPPFGLFGVGAVMPALQRGEQGPVVAIVGSRRPTGAGRRLASEIAGALAQRGAVVVSGLARGIDGAAHEGALDAGGVTIAVLGSAVDRVHPRRHQALAERIAIDGAVISEYWPGTDAAPWRFPARNRIVAGMADAVVVVEAAARSGALITADFAMENGTPVLAVPGWPGAEMSAGSNALLRAGAALCEGADDVVAEVTGRAWAQVAEPVGAPGVQGAAAVVLAQLGREPAGIDRLAAATGLPHADVAVAIAALEIEGRIAREDGGVFRAVARRPGPGRDG
jgi:DNA processing protein